MRQEGRTAVATLALAGIAGVVDWAAPVSAAIAGLRDPQATADRYGVDALLLAAAGAACWLALAWLVVAMGVLAATALPGRCGHVAHAVAARTVPPAMRRLLALGLGLAVVTSAGSAAASATELAQAPRGAHSAVDLDWPLGVAPAATTEPAGTTTPAARSTVSSLVGSMVVVRPGDCLWSIAAGHAPAGAGNAAIAAAWPRWYAANRAVIGADPNLLLPGQHLSPPSYPLNDRLNDRPGDSS